MKMTTALANSLKSLEKVEKNEDMPHTGGGAVSGGGGGATLSIPCVQPRSNVTVVPVGAVMPVVPAAAVVRPPSGGKRGAVGPLVTTSDEDDSGPDSPRSSKGQSEDLTEAVYKTLHDHDYDNVSSPGNASTESGPTYVRTPGFVNHAHSFTVSKPRMKKIKKSTQIFPMKVGKDAAITEPTPPKTKPKRDPLPMRMRALPQSFWQQPNVAHNVSPAQTYPVLPPLFNKDGTEEDEDSILNVRPVTPPGEKDERVSPPKNPERKMTVANTDLLFKLFDGVMDKDKGKKTPANQTYFSNYSHTYQCKRGRPKKHVHGTIGKTLMTGEDPYLVGCVTDKLFPQLTLDGSTRIPLGGGNGSQTIHVVTLREGDRSVTLPSLGADQNFSQMLSDLVMTL